MAGSPLSHPSAGAAEEQPIGGWLRLLCWLLIVWQPASTAAAALQGLAALPVRGLPVVGVLLLRVIVAGLSVAASLALQGLRPGAVRLALIALAAAMAADLFVYVTPYFPNNRMPGDTPFYMAATVAYHMIWIMYLARSRRVRRTFGA